MKKTKLSQSAIPYLCLLASLIIGIPIVDKQANANKNQDLVFQVEQVLQPIAQCEIMEP